eukprot:m.306143 g.306143  ORF g.306143 m.306143 type:complete len:136 (+) comp41004_c0_seq1:778-1185(+)
MLFVTDMNLLVNFCWKKELMFQLRTVTRPSHSTLHANITIHLSASCYFVMVRSIKLKIAMTVSQFITQLKTATCQHVNYCWSKEQMLKLKTMNRHIKSTVAEIQCPVWKPTERTVSTEVHTLKQLVCLFSTTTKE